MPITETAPSPPPVRRAGRPTATAIKAVTLQADQRKQRRIDGMNSIGSGIHMLFLATGQHADAGAINKHTPNITKEIAEYADGDDAFGEKLDRLSDVTPIAGIVTAVIPLVLQLAVNHGLFGFKAEQFAPAGVVTPETLRAESATMLIQMQNNAVQDQIRVEHELRESAQVLNDLRSERESNAE